jgi:hypothetical protein
VTFSRSCLFATIALSLTVFASSFASAQDDVRKRGDRACGGDSRKMCSKFARARPAPDSLAVTPRRAHASAWRRCGFDAANHASYR